MTPSTDREWGELAREAALALREHPNVHTVGVGGRRRAGKPTGEPVLIVFVSRKVPPTELPTSALVPREFQGVPTDVVEAGRPRRAATVPGAQWGGPYDNDTGRHRPLRGGSRITGAAESEFSGTLGFFMKTATIPNPLIVAVTAHHTLFATTGWEVTNMEVGQPTPSHSAWGCCDNVFGFYLSGARDASMDAAAIALLAKQDYYAQIDDIGVIAGTHDVTTAEAATGTYSVRKRGAGTGLTGGTVHAIQAHTTDMSIQNYMSIIPNAASSGTPGFADHGDSGAAVVDDAGEVVGMIWGIEDTTGQQDSTGPLSLGWAYAWQIADVISRLNASGAGYTFAIETATTLGDKRTVPGASPASTAAVVSPPVAQRLEADLARTPEGRRLTELWLRHVDELRYLITQSKRTTVQWHRSGGAALVQCALRMAYDPRLAFPREIAGRPTEQCGDEILSLLEQIGSPELRRDIHAFRELMPPIGGRSYQQILAALAAGSRQVSPWQA